MSVFELLAMEKEGTVRYHHTACHRGYVSRRGWGEVVPYSGRFGVGYKLLMPRWDTSSHVWVRYYITQGV